MQCRKKFFVPLHSFGSTSAISCFCERFRDCQFLVCSTHGSPCHMESAAVVISLYSDNLRYVHARTFFTNHYQPQVVTVCSL